MDVYFSVDVETDGPIPGPYSMLSFAIVEAGMFDGKRFVRRRTRDPFYQELRPISESFDPEALAVSGLDRERLVKEGASPATAMNRAAEWIAEHSIDGTPVLVAYPLSFDWTWLYWYFIRFLGTSPFKHSRCFDLKTAVSVSLKRPLSSSGLKQLPDELKSGARLSHHALADASDQAEILAKLFESLEN